MAITQTIEELRSILCSKNIELNRAQLSVFKQQPVNYVDHLNIAIEQMAHSNIAAFILLSDQQNHLAAMSFIRMHLDCLLKLFSTFIIKEKETWISSLLYAEDKNWKKKIKINEKKKALTDKFLCEQLESQGYFARASELYKYSCDFIHPSDKHFSSAIREWIILPDKTVQWKTMINIFGITEISEDIIKSNYICMLEITDCIIRYIKLTKTQTLNFIQFELA